MTANVTIWKIDRKDQSIMTPEYVDMNGRYDASAVDEKMIRGLVSQFAYCKPNVSKVSLFKCGETNATWAFASDGPDGNELYLVRVLEK